MLSRNSLVGCVAVFCLVWGCGEKSANPVAGTAGKYVGTWEYTVTVFSDVYVMDYTVNTNNTFTYAAKVNSSTIETTSGTYRTTADSIFFHSTDCREDTLFTDTLKSVPCDDPATAVDESTGAQALSGITGTTWVMIDAKGTPYSFTKK